MSERETTVRVSATGGVNVRVGDRVRRGQELSAGPSTDGPVTAPVSGLISAIQFDADNHEFVFTITATA